MNGNRDLLLRTYGVYPATPVLSSTIKTNLSVMKAFGFFILLLGYSLQSHACSCALRNASQEFADVDEVFSAKLVSSKRALARVSGEGDKPITVERAVLVVLKVWKGSRKPGDRIQLQNIVQRPPPTSCTDKNTTNKPMWVEMEDRNERLPDTWLIYASGPEPFRLSQCSMSLPLPWAVTAGDVAELDALVNKRTP